MSDNVNILLVGAGFMAREYCKVLKGMGEKFFVVGRSEESAKKFEEEMEVPVLTGGVERNISKMQSLPTHAIVAVDVNQLAVTTKLLLEIGIKNILVEKPAALCRRDLEELCSLAKKKEAVVYVAYNRRFYASTQEAIKIIKEDGGVSSFQFEFTEWGHEIEKLSHPKEIKEKWFLANSTHVVDLAFYLGGFPQKMSSYMDGSLEWHKKGSKYAGAGVSDKGAMFSYQANWDAPGRWAVEVLTSKHRLYLKPMEELWIQEKGSVKIEKIEFDNQLDMEYKPGLYLQTESFLMDKEDGKKITIFEQLEHWKCYEEIAGEDDTV